MPNSDNNIHKTGLLIDKIEFYKDATILYFTYDNSYGKAEWINMNKSCKIKAYPSGNTYFLKKVEGIPYSPNKYNLQSRYDIVKFKCIFPAVPVGTRSLDWSESSDWQINYITSQAVNSVYLLDESYYTSGNINDKISSVTAFQDGKEIRISYKLSKEANIKVFVSIDGGENYSTLKKVSGDIGKNIKPGNKAIHWRVLDEYENFNYENVCFKVDEYDIPTDKKKELKKSSYASTKRTIYRYNSSNSYKNRIYNPYLKEQGNFEFTWLGINGALGQSFNAGIITLRMRYKWLQLCPADMLLGVSLSQSGFFFAYQPAVNFVVPVMYNGAVYFGAGPDIRYLFDYSYTHIWFKTEFGFRYHWGASSSDFFFRYDGDFAVGMSLQI